MIAKDLLLDENGDLLIKNGDFVAGPSDLQHIEDIIKSFPGWHKQFPTIGVGIRSYLGSSGLMQQLQASIRLQLKADGYTINSIKSQTNAEGTYSITVNCSRGGVTINKTITL